MPLTIDPMIPLRTARDILMTARFDKEAVICPCCDQHAKVYKRSLMLSQVKVMATLYNRSRKAPIPTAHWVKIGTKSEVAKLKNGPNVATVDEDRPIYTSGGDYAKARYWGLIEESGEGRDDGSARAGLWRITESGIDFLLGAIRVPKYMAVYNNAIVPEQPACAAISVYDVAKTFDFRALMDAE